MAHTVQNQSGSDLGGLVWVWPNTSGLKAIRCAGIIWPSFWQDATCPLPVFHSKTQLHSSTDILDNIVQNQPRSGIVLADCFVFWPNGSGPEASQCARIIQPASCQCFRADLDWIRHVYWDNSNQSSLTSRSSASGLHIFCSNSVFSLESLPFNLLAISIILI